MKNIPVTKVLLMALLGCSFLLSSCTEAISTSSITTKKEVSSDSNTNGGSDPNKGTTIGSKKPPVQYRIADLPVPDNYRLNEDKSFIFETANLKTGILVYNGGRDIADVVEFYKEEMPKYGWTLIHVFQHKEANMLFDKEDWVCTITMEGSWSSNVLSLRIAPKDPGSAPPPNK